MLGKPSQRERVLLTSVALCPGLLPLAHWLHPHWLSLTSQRTLVASGPLHSSFCLKLFFFFCLCFCFVKIGFFIPFDLLSDLVSSERSSVTILAKWVLMTLGSATPGHSLYPFLSSSWSSALIMLLASSFMVCLSHQTLSSMTTGGWLPSYYGLPLTSDSELYDDGRVASQLLPSFCH